MPLCLHSIHVRMRAAYTGVRYLSLSLSLSLSYTHTHKTGQVCSCIICIDYPLLSIAVFTGVYCVDGSIRQHTAAYATLPPAHQLHGKAVELLDYTLTLLSRTHAPRTSYEQSLESRQNFALKEIVACSRAENWSRTCPACTLTSQACVRGLHARLAGGRRPLLQVAGGLCCRWQEAIAVVPSPQTSKQETSPKTLQRAQSKGRCSAHGAPSTSFCING